MIIGVFRGSITVELIVKGTFTTDMQTKRTKLTDRAPSADSTTYGFVITSGSISVPDYSKGLFSSPVYPILTVLVPLVLEFFVLQI